MSTSDDTDRGLSGEVRHEQTKLLGVRAYELARDALDNEIAISRRDITTLIEFLRDDLTTQLKRLEHDGTVVFDTIGDAMHDGALELDRRLAQVAALTRTSERMHYSDSLVPVA